MINSTDNHPVPLRTLRNRTAFITGGSSGIGLGIAHACLTAGMHVVITYQTEAHVIDARSHIGDMADRFFAIKADVGSRRSMQTAARTAEKLVGPINLICCNAGVGITTRITDASSDDWNHALRVNLLGVIHTIDSFLATALSGDEPTHFAATSSMSGLFHGASAGLYTTTKFAVVGLMESLRSELTPVGIGVTTLCPGLVQTRIGEHDSRRRAHTHSDLQLEDDPDLLARRSRIKSGMSIEECASIFLQGIQRNDMYVITHPEFRQGLRDRFEALDMSFPPDPGDPPEARLRAEKMVLRHPVYRSERSRLENRPALTPANTPATIPDDSKGKNNCTL